MQTDRFGFIRSLSWGGVLFALLQSACTAFIALNGVRVLIGVGSLAVATGVVHFLDSVHADKIRIPMMIVALAGSLLNLAVLWQARRLRRRPAAQWRVRPLSPSKRRSERLQLGLSFLTLLLLAVEEYAHVALHHGNA